MNLSPKVQNILPQCIAWRRHLHMHPELSFEEVETTAFLLEELGKISGLELHTPTRTGVVAVLKGAYPGRTIAIRGDIDALPIQEETELPFASRVPGVMHACGHDIHTSNLLTVAEILDRTKDQWKGKVKLVFQPAEEKEIRILFDDKTFRFYDTRTDSWEVETGTYQIMIGSNAEEMLLAGSLAVNGTVTEGGYSRESLPEYFNGEIKNISDDTFRRLYGREIPDGSWSGEIRMNDAVCQLYYGKGIFGKLFYGVLRILLKISEWQGKPNLNVLFNYNMPIRGYAKMTGGFVTMKMAEALTEMANGHRIRGTAHLIKAAVKRD